MSLRNQIDSSAGFAQLLILVPLAIIAASITLAISTTTQNVFPISEIAVGGGPELIRPHETEFQFISCVICRITRALVKNLCLVGEIKLRYDIYDDRPA